MRNQEPYRINPRSDGSGQWLVTLRPESGVAAHLCTEWTRRSLSRAPAEFLAATTWPKSQAAANRVAQALIVYLKEHTTKPLTPSVTIGEYSKLFTSLSTSPRANDMLAGGQEYSPQTIRMYEGLWRLHVSPDRQIAELPLNQAGADELKQYFTRLAKKLGGPCRTHQAVWAFLRMVFSQYEIDHQGFIDPFRRLRKPKYKEVSRDALSDVEIDSIFTKPGVFTSTLEQAVVATAFWAGLRRSEIFALTWAHIDFDGGTIRVRQAWKNFDKKNRTIGAPKWGKARDVPLSTTLAELLKRLKKEYGTHEYVFSYPDGRVPGCRWWNSHIRGVFKRAGIQAEGRKIEPHSARHSLGSQLEAEGIQIRYIQSVLGHTSEKTTKGYLHMAGKELNNVASTIERKMKSHKKEKE